MRDSLPLDALDAPDSDSSLDPDADIPTDSSPPPIPDADASSTEDADTATPPVPLILLPKRAARGSAWTFRFPHHPDVLSIEILWNGAPDPTVILSEPHADGGDGWIPAEALPESPPGPRTAVIQTANGLEERRFQVDLAEGEMGLAVGNGELGKTLDPTAALDKELFFPVGLAYAEDVLFYTDAGWNTIEAVAVGSAPLQLFGGALTAPPGVAIPIAGIGGPGDSVDGPALEVPLSEPKGLCHRRDGEDRLLFFADTTHHQLRVLNLGASSVVEMGHVVEPGHIVTLAGKPVYGYGGDGGDALDATFFRPWRVCGCAGDFLVTGDVENYRVRAVNRSSTALQLGDVLLPPGFVDTLAGDGTLGYSGDGGPATAAQVSIPKGFAITEDDVLIFSDPENNAVRAINVTQSPRMFNGIPIAPGTVETVGIPGFVDGFSSTPGYFHPTAIRLDSDALLYSADTYSQTIKLHNTRTGPVVRAGVTAFPGATPIPLAGVEHFKGGTLESAPALETLMAAPFDIALDEVRGDLYVADVENHTIRRLKLHAPRPAFSGELGPFPSLSVNTASAPHILNADTGVLTRSDGSTHALGATSGVWSFTSVNLPEGVFLRIEGTRPAAILASGPVTIAGTIRIDSGALGSGPGIGTGQGGGGHANPGDIGGSGTPGNPYGSESLSPLTAGSAGGGALGGGALLVASQQALTISGTLDASGNESSNGGAGSGGGVRLVSGGDLVVTATGHVRASGGAHAGGQGAGSDGRIRFEATGELTLSGEVLPAATTAKPETLGALKLPGL
jgi:hypothetical protein